MPMIVDVVNYFEEIDILFCSLCIEIFLVELHVTCVGYSLKHFFKTKKEKQTYLNTK